jgi:CxxC motif-containing protein (DUF1111 family)
MRHRYKMKHLLISAAAIFMIVGCSSEPSSSKKEGSQLAQFTNSDSKTAFTKAFDFETNEELDMHILGKSFFRVPWVEAPSATTARDGLGPLFSANTCIHCHPNNGAGLAVDKDGAITRSLVMRLSLSHVQNINNNLITKNGFMPEPTYGGQLSFNGTSDVAYEGSAEVKYTYIDKKYDDGSSYQLRSPAYSLTKLQYADLHKDANVAPHIALALIGLGAIESIPAKDILANEDVEDKDKDGISGKANWVYNPETNTTELGRFTWKAAAASVKHQSANAAHNDMGLSNPLYPKHNCTDAQEDCLKALEGRHEFDLPMERLDAISFYLKTLKIPAQRKSENFEKGQKIFNDLGCVKCHVESFQTSDGVEIKPYSDFLLHDMGEALADGHRVFKADASEFRTPPLWGLGLYEKASGELNLLHDGRARSAEEAILWHGGEAQKQAEAFKALSKKDRDYLVEFLHGI